MRKSWHDHRIEIVYHSIHIHSLDGVIDHGENIFDLRVPTPEFMLRLALGEFADTLLTGQKVLPQRLMDAGFTFKFATIEAALENLLG